MQRSGVALLVLGIVASGWGTFSRAAEPLELPVWPGKAPGETEVIGPETEQEQRPDQRVVRRLANVSTPTIAVYQPPAEKRCGSAVLVCPGGGYNILAMDLEGTEVAEWLNSKGVTAIVLKYRVPRRKNLPPHQAPLQDAQRAMSLARSKAKEWGIDADRIGILGFSAGGHLSAATMTNFDRRSYERIDSLDDVSSRPDFGVLVYPAYLVDKEMQMMPELRVTAQTPPTFFAHAANDPVLPENSIGMFLALKKAGVSGELHVYASGGHGFGLRPSEHPSSKWPQRCEEWMRARRLLSSSASWGVKQIIAHRGASADRPENTKASAARAIEAGATAVEVDVRTTRDGKLVLLHDATLDRMTNGSGPVNAKTLDEVRALDAGSRFDPKWKGEKVGTLDEVLALCRGKIDVLLDLKEEGDAYLQNVVDAVQKQGDPKRTIVGVRSVDQAKQIRARLPEGTQIGLISSPDEIEAFAKAGVETIRLWPKWLVDDALPQRVRAAGAKLHLNGTTGTPGEIAPLLKYRPDSLSSDDPHRLTQTLRGL